MVDTYRISSEGCRDREGGERGEREECTRRLEVEATPVHAGARYWQLLDRVARRLQFTTPTRTRSAAVHNIHPSC